jgi:hypothetical protein
MRSASSAGETVTKNTQDPHVSMPKRAETFNGASSSKESQISTLNLNANILQSYLQKSNNNNNNNQNNNNSISNNNNNNNLNNNDSNSSNVNSVKISKTNSNASDTATRSNTNSDLSTDFGYHSRLCVDINHDLDAENCSCSLFDNNNNNNNNTNNINSNNATIITTRSKVS